MPHLWLGVKKRYDLWIPEKRLCPWDAEKGCALGMPKKECALGVPKKLVCPDKSNISLIGCLFVTMDIFFIQQSIGQFWISTVTEGSTRQKRVV